MNQHGFIINPRVDTPKAAVDALRGIPVAILGDSVGRLSGSFGLRPMHDGTPMAGIAFTIKTRPGDNLMIHKALQLAKPGDILVVDGSGALEHALIGELMTLTARARKLGGWVIDGAIRDADAIAKGDYPCFARGVSHRGPYKDGPGQINVPVTIGGMAVNPGDVIIGDGDGLIAIPPEFAATVAAVGRQREANEQKVMADIAAGRFNDSWIDEVLKAKGAI